MGQDVILKGASIKLYLNGNIYPCEGVSYSIDYAEDAIYGIDSLYPQEIATTKVSVAGQVNGLVLQMDGGLQGRGLRPLLKDALASPYISVRIQDIYNQVDLLNVNDVKVTNESVNISAKGLIRINFGFKGIYPSQTLDLA
jgi:hypothetical protein